MRPPEQTEKFAGQRLLATDPRSERPVRSCPACASNKTQKLGIKNELEIVSCTECHTLYSPYTPWYTSETYYGNYYEHPFSEEPPIVAQRLREIMAEFSKYRLRNHLLDVGCGAGLLLQIARENGWNAHGLDVSESSVKHVRTLGLEVFQGELNQAGFETERFDVITAVEFVEHLVDPMTVVSEVHRVLRPGGLFWLTTPHAGSLTARLKGLSWRSISPPEHLQLFSIEGMRKLLLRAGFRDVHFETTGIDPLELWRRSAVETPNQNSEALESKYRLNEAMTSSNSRRLLKDSLNAVLNLTKLGDSLKVFAIR